MSLLFRPDPIAQRIHYFRGHRVMLDADLAQIYGVPTQRLVDEIHQHGPLPGDFCFPVERHELDFSDDERPGRGEAAYVFTEHGALMAATLLKSPEAIALSAHVIRTFVSLRRRG